MRSIEGMVRGLGGGSPLEIRSGKGGVATQEEGTQRRKGKVPAVRFSFHICGQLASGAPYHGHREGTHMAAWTVPRAMAHCVSVTGQSICVLKVPWTSGLKRNS